MTASITRIGEVPVGDGKLVLIAGPCMAESLGLCQEIAGSLSGLCSALGLRLVFKASFDKANRSSSSSYRGPGLEKGLEWLSQVKRQTGCPVLSDVHEVAQAAPAAQVLDCLQIPAFLCRQTDLIQAAARTGKAVNIKKGQFMAPWEMKQAAEKVRAEGNANVLLTERGTFFGYNRLVNDFRGLGQMRQFAPVVFDATHSVQEPGALGHASGGQRQFVPLLAGAAAAAGIDALFIETHPSPEQAKSDAATQWPLGQMKELLQRCLAIHQAAGDPLQ